MKTIVWDFNGVVVDDIEAHRMATNAALALFDTPHRLHTIDDARRATTVPYAHGFMALGVTQADLMARIGDVDAAYHDAYLQSPQAFAPRNGVPETLALIRKNGWKNIILSNTRRDILDIQLERMGMTDSFDWISTSDQRSQTGIRLNKTERLHGFFNLQSSPEAGFIIGDSTEEIDVARAMGLQSIAVLGGWFDEIRLAEKTPDYMVGCTSGIAGVLKQNGLAL